MEPAQGIFAPSPVPSNQLQATGINVPMALSDHDAVHEPAVKRQRVADGENYNGLVTHYLHNGIASADDRSQSARYLFSTCLSENLDGIQRNLAPIAAAEIVQLLAPQFDQLRAQNNELRARQNNSSVDHDADVIEWFAMPPVLVNGVMQQQPIPAVAPQTKGELFALLAVNANTLLGYYGLPLGGDVIQKRKRLARHLGLLRMLWR